MLCFLAGYAGQTTLEELEDEAVVTGNWSKVEARERLLQQQDKKFGPPSRVNLAVAVAVQQSAGAKTRRQPSVF